VRARIRLTDDEDAVEMLDRECLPVEDNAPIDFSRSPEMWLATADGDHIGYAVATQQNENAAHFDRYGVSEAARGNGLGKRLIGTVLRWAKARGLFYVHTYTYPQNVESINALVGCGFRAWLPPPSEYGLDDTPEVRAFMAKSLFWRRDL
jgi:GNAT superfamily N-acetyltransferase